MVEISRLGHAYVGRPLLSVDSFARPDDLLYWYRRADALGDTRAAGRAHHLKRRIALDAARPEPTAGTVVDPMPMELQALYRQDYHCHNMYGEQWCHLANDF